MAKTEIVISSDAIGKVDAVIETDKNPNTARAVLDALPIEARGMRWGDEIYFSIPVDVGEENSQDVVEKGDIAYWPPGNAFCIFFGRTPASVGDEIRPASSVNVIGRITGDVSVLKNFPSGSKIRIEPKT